MVGKVNPTEKINAGSESFDEDLAGMESEFEFVGEKATDGGNEFLKLRAAGGENHKIVGVAEGILLLESVFNELVQLVQVDIGEKLGSKVAER